MRSKPLQNTDRSYLKGLLFDPILRGKWRFDKRQAHSVPYTRPFYLASLAWLVGIASSAATAFGGYYFYEHRTLDGFKILIASFGFFFLIQGICFLLRKNCRCPLCRGNVLVNGKNKKSNKACKLKPLGFAGTSMFSILIRQSFRCHHCGTPFYMKKGFRNKNKK